MAGVVGIIAMWIPWIVAVLFLDECQIGYCCFGDSPNLLLSPKSESLDTGPSYKRDLKGSSDFNDYSFERDTGPDSQFNAEPNAGASAQPDIGLQITGLKAALGGNINAFPLANTLTGDAVLSAGDLQCGLETRRQCRWGNTNGDALQWSRGTGRAELNRWLFITNTREQPDPDFLMLASNPRSSRDSGYLVSDPILCQDGDGTVTFRNPFELVIKGSNFINEPEGGFIVVDDINYKAKVAQDCLLNFQPPDNFDPNSNGNIGQSTRDGGVNLDNFIRPDQPEFPPPDFDKFPPQDRIPLPALLPAPAASEHKQLQPESQQTASPELLDQDSCFAAACSFTLANGFCQLNPIGQRAKGEGIHTGWQLVTGNTNRANPLTGIRYNHERDRDGGFAVATFPDPRKTEVDPGLRYVLESPPITFSRAYYLNFKRWIAIDGAVLKLCRDGDGIDCLWESQSLIRGPTDASANRGWIDEVVALPPGTYKLFMIAQYDIQRKYNVGQVGLSYLHFYKDLNLRSRLC